VETFAGLSPTEDDLVPPHQPPPGLEPLQPFQNRQETITAASVSFLICSIFVEAFRLFILLDFWISSFDAQALEPGEVWYTWRFGTITTFFKTYCNLPLEIVTTGFRSSRLNNWIKNLSITVPTKKTLSSLQFAPLGIFQLAGKF
jgi:hypothetical protein